MGNFTDPQRANAATIISVGRSLGASDRDIQIALMTALQESDLLNIDYGDRDSVGLFQQRDAWGTHSQRMDPAASARMFFTGGADGQRGLLDFRGRDQLSLTQAAQAVQVSAYPNAYAKHESAALSLLGADAPRGTSERTAPGQAMDPGVSAGPAVQPTIIDNRPQPSGVSAQAGAARRESSAAGQAIGIKTPTAVGIEAATTPGVGSVDTLGVSAPGGPSEPPAPSSPAEPTDPGFTTMDRASFNATFPDAETYFGNTDARRGDVVTAAMSYIGTPYVWGGNGRGGVDCSGLVQQVFKGFGIDLPRLSADQARAGEKVALSGLKAGDLVAWDNFTRNNGADHIAVYAGNGWIIEAPRPGLDVRRRRLSESDYTEAYGVHLAQLS